MWLAAPAPQVNFGLIGSLAGNFREIFINDGAEVFSARIYPKLESQDIIFTPEDEVLAIDDVTYYKLDCGLPHPLLK